MKDKIYKILENYEITDYDKRLITDELFDLLVVMPQLLCVDESYYVNLTNGNKYELIKENKYHYIINDDKGYKCQYKKKHFMIVTQ